MANTIEISLVVDDKGSAVVKTFSKNAEDAGHKTSSFGSRAKEAAVHLGSMAGQVAAAAVKIGALGVAAAGALGGAVIAKSIKEFASFEVAVRDLGKVTDESFDQISEKILALPPEIGSSTELVKGYYQTISAGVTEPAAAMETLVVASKAAKSAHVDQSEVIKGLTKVMAGFQGEIQNVTDASDLLFTIEKEGQTSFLELIPVIGELAATSKQLGVTHAEMGGALALVTQTAGSTSQAATQYQGVLMALMKPTTEMSKAVSSMGYESAQAMIKQEGLSGTLQKLNEYTGGSVEMTNKLFGNLEGLKGMAALSANNFADLAKKTDAMKDATGASAKAWDDYMNTLSSVWETFKNAIGKQATMLGKELAPAIKEVLGNVVAWLEANRGLIAQGIAEWVGKIEVAIRAGLPTMTEFIGYVKTAIDVLGKFADAIVTVVGWFVDFSAWIGKTAAQVVIIADKVGRFLGLIKDFGTTTATVKFEGEGSTVRPLGEKCDEMTGKVGAFGEYINSLSPTMTADFTPISSALDGLRYKAEDTMISMINMFAEISTWETFTATALVEKQKYLNDMVKNIRDERVKAVQEEAYLSKIMGAIYFNDTTKTTNSNTVNNAISINITSQSGDPQQLAMEMRKQLKELDYRYN